MTEVLDAGDPEAVLRAAEALRSGRLVAFPTETVYGLGAAALDVVAVRSVFAAKGRPSTDPLIVHVRDAVAARELCAGWPGIAERLAERFWPGPLSLVVPRAPQVPDEVVAGGPSVAVRVPAHPVARELIDASGVPIAAPSANRFGRISPTTAGHVVEELGGSVDILLDGGPTPLGIESTVVRVSDGTVEVLRPGGVTVEDLAEVVDPAGARLVVPERRAVAEDAAAESPGQLLRHYAPVVPLVLVEARAGTVGELRSALAAHGVQASVVDLPRDGAGAAPRLYSELREADSRGADVLLVEVVDPAGIGRAVNDRLFRAAHGRVVTDSTPASVERLVALARPA